MVLDVVLVVLEVVLQPLLLQLLLLQLLLLQLLLLRLRVLLKLPSPSGGNFFFRQQYLWTGASAGRWGGGASDP